MPRKKARTSDKHPSLQTKRKKRRVSSSTDDREDLSGNKAQQQTDAGAAAFDGNGDPSHPDTSLRDTRGIIDDSAQHVHARSRDAAEKDGDDTIATASKAAEEWEGRAFERIKLDGLAKKNRRWHVLVPKTRHALRLRKMQCIKLGATYPSAESAARAADRALIAMWGRMDAEDYLNFPSSDYSDCIQLYGVDLTRFLLDIVEHGKEMVEKAKNASRVTKQTEYSSRLRRVYQQNKTLREKCDALISDQRDLFTFHKTSCGVCVNCRQPWLDKVCARYKEARDMEYKFREHAKLIVDGPELSAYKMAIQRAKGEGNKDLAQRITEAMYSKYPLPEIEEREAGDTRKEKTDVPNTQVEKTADTLVWLIKPFPNKKTREYNTKHTESAHAQLQLQLTLSAQREMNQMKRAALEYDDQNVSEYQIKRKSPNRKVYEELLTSIDQAAEEGLDLLFIREDARTWLKPNTYRLNQCSYCKTWHRPHLEYCPLMQATCALEKDWDIDHKKPLCRVCKDEGENCRACLARCSIPDFLHHPLRVPAPFMSEISPDMQNLLESMKRMSDSAITEFKSPHLSATLTPESFLALALVAEAMVDNAINERTLV